MPIHPVYTRTAWALAILVATTPGQGASQINSQGACTTPGLVMTGVFSEGRGLMAGPGGFDQLTVHDWPFRLECVHGRLRLTLKEARGTEVTHSVIEMHQESRVLLVTFRGDELLSPQSPLIMLKVMPGMLPRDPPVVFYTDMDGNSVMLLRGVLAFVSPAYKSYVPAWH